LLQGILQAADDVLDLACRLVALAVSLKLGVTQELASSFLDGPLDLLG
jgi:hypothetical protein